MEVLNLIRLFWEWVFPYISLTYSLYIGENLHFRYLECSVIHGAYSSLHIGGIQGWGLFFSIQGILFFTVGWVLGGSSPLASP